MTARQQPTSAVAPVVDEAQITALLRGAGAIAAPSEGGIKRMQIDGSTFVAGDQLYPYNARTKAPAFTARIVEPVIEYQGFFFDKPHAEYASRPHMEGKFCKSYFDVDGQRREYAEDGTKCRECPVMPFLKTEDTPLGRKCQWKADLRLQIVPDSGELTGEEPVWVLTLPTTSVIEFKGTAREPVKGALTDKTFMHKLALLAVQQNADNPDLAVLKALTAYHQGLVVAQFRLPRATSADGSRTWPVIVADPIFIGEPDPEAPAIEAGPAEPRNVTPSSTQPDNLPF